MSNVPIAENQSRPGSLDIPPQSCHWGASLSEVTVSPNQEKGSVQFYFLPTPMSTAPGQYHSLPDTHFCSVSQLIMNTPSWQAAFTLGSDPHLHSHGLTSQVPTKQGYLSPQHQAHPQFSHNSPFPAPTWNDHLSPSRYNPPPSPKCIWQVPTFCK